MKPTPSDTPVLPESGPQAAGTGDVSGQQASSQHAPLAAVGPERMAWLREAIRSGAYPKDEDVLRGLTRVFRPEAPEDAN